MMGLSTALLAATLAASGTPLMPINWGNALTLPAHRHAVRIETGEGRPPTDLFAVQQDGANGHGLGMFRSDDGARSFRYLGAIQADSSHSDRADLVAVGRDVALVYSYENSDLEADSRHDVYFQWWRYQAGSNTWTPQPAVRVFNADDSTAFSRAELARDSLGRLWVQAFRLESDGSSTAVLAVSTDGGATFQKQANLGHVKHRGGGRLLATGGKLVFIYAMHDGFEPTRMRLRRDTDALGTWGAVQNAFSDGIYHGAALSAVEDGHGGMHLVYKDEAERLYYRHFDGGTFGSRVLVENSPDWALQPAITRIGDTLYVFFNHVRVPDESYELRARVLKNGSFSEQLVLDTRATFKGYLNAFDVLPASSTEVPCFWGDTPVDNTPGYIYRLALPNDDVDTGGGSDGTDGGMGSPDGGTGGSTDGGTTGGTDGGTGGSPDGGTTGGTDGGTDGGTSGTPVPGALLFADEFTRKTTYGMGSAWTLQGLWYTDGARAISDLDGKDLALAVPSRCGDCMVEVRLQQFEVNEAGVVMRSSGSGDSRYALLFLRDGRLQIRRYSGSGYTVLGTASSGFGGWDEVALTFTVTGTAPVKLIASANGQVRLTVTDASSAALTAPGLAGLQTPIAGVWFDDFKVKAVAP